MNILIDMALMTAELLFFTSNDCTGQAYIPATRVTQQGGPVELTARSYLYQESTTKSGKDRCESFGPTTLFSYPVKRQPHRGDI